MRYEPDGAKKAAGNDADRSDADKSAEAKSTEDKSDDAADQPATADNGAAEVDETSCGRTPFKKEAYRLPTFEVLLHAPDRTPLDGPFSVDLIARYFSGGLVANRPIKWRASQFPYALDASGPRGLPFLVGRTLLERGRVQGDPGVRPRWHDGRRRCRAHHVRPDDRADGAAAPLPDRGDGDRRRRRAGAQRHLRHRAAGLRPRREDTPLRAEGGSVRAGNHCCRCGRQTGRRARVDGAFRAPQLVVDPAGERLRARRCQIRHAGHRRDARRTEDHKHARRTDIIVRDERGRRLPRAGRGDRPYRPPPADQRRHIRRRQHARDLVARAGADRRDHEREGRLRAGRSGDARHPVAFSDRAGARDRRRAQRPLPHGLGRHRQRLRALSRRSHQG